MRTCGVPLCIQDTLELKFNGRMIAGLRSLQYETQRGMYVHPTYAVTPQREPLDAWMWAREPKHADGLRSGGKESTRWVDGYDRVAELAAGMTTRLAYVADRESDILALNVKARDLGRLADWLIRSRTNRVLPNGGKLWDDVTACVPMGTICFTMPARKDQKVREVRQQIWAKRVDLADRAKGVERVTCLVERELEATAGVTPVEWRPLSNREVADFEASAQLIFWYRAR